MLHGSRTRKYWEVTTTYQFKAYTNSTSTKAEDKRETEESQLKERGSGLKTTANEFMESVLKTRWEMLFPSLAVPGQCIKVENVATSLFRGDGPYITQTLEGNYLTNAASSRITTNLKKEVRDFLHLHVSWRVHSDWKHCWKWLPQRRQRRRRARRQWRWRRLPVKITVLV